MSPNRRPLVAYAVATWFGAGRFPVGPGTAGSIAAILIAAAAWYWAAIPPWWFSIAAIVLFIPGAWSARIVEQTERLDDPSFVVVDEVVGQWLTLALVDPNQPLEWLFALVLFRIFDIAKPPPLRRLERLGGGLGVLADDLCAGVYAILGMGLAKYWI